MSLIKNPSHFISVIVPVYKQENSIVKDLKNIAATLDQIRYDYEIISVVDGTTSDKSFQKILNAKIPKLKVYGYPTNFGKGFAVRYGMARTKGDYVAFIDAGMEIDPNGISMVIEHLEWYNADIVVGSKRHPASLINYPIERKLLSFGAFFIARYLLGINVHDTQAGLKIFKRQVLIKVLPRLLIKRYAFDLEILSVANYLGFKKIYEAPIKLTYQFAGLTHATGLSTIISSLKDSLAVFYRLKILNYYNDNNQRHWVYQKELAMRINTG